MTTSSWNFENDFHHHVGTDRWDKYLAQYETVKLCSCEGAVVEVGVHKLNSLIRLYAFHQALGINVDFYGFDVFSSFPISNPHDALDSDFSFVSDFEQKTGGAFSFSKANSIISELSMTRTYLIEGDIFDTIPASLNLFSQGIRLLHIDVDIYPATLFALTSLVPLCNPGAIVLLDDYSHVEGATKAIDEFLLRSHSKFILKSLGTHRKIFYFQID